MEFVNKSLNEDKEFWNYFYRYPMKYLTFVWQNKIKKEFQASNLELDGKSEAHFNIIKSVIQNNQDAQMCIWKTFGSTDIDGTTLGIKKRSLLN